MASYQVVCSVIRPRPPTEQCQIHDFQEKVQQHISSVFHDVHLDSNIVEIIDNQEHARSAEEGERRAVSVRGNNQILCALVSKTRACFSGEDNFQSRVKLPYFWCNFCPFSTESRPSLVQHLTSQHCFRCQHCPHVAFTRSDVAKHSLHQHPEFQRQAREQKLKGCHLQRDIFQRDFAPDPVPHTQPSRKHASGAADRNDDDAGTSKQARNDGDAAPHNEVEAANSFDMGFDSSSDSSEMNSPSDRTQQRRDAARDNDVSGDERNDGARLVLRTKSLSENIVSSSSMDVEAGSDFYAYPEPSTVDEAASSPDRELPHADGVGDPHLTIKQEVKSEEGFSFTGQQSEGGDLIAPGLENTFISTLGATESTKDSFALDGTEAFQQHAVFPVGEAVRVKTEPQSDDEGFTVNTSHPVPQQVHLREGRSQQAPERSSAVHGSRPDAAASPPLSSIRVENLQRQFEESVRNINLGFHENEHSLLQVRPSSLKQRSHTVGQKEQQSGMQSFSSSGSTGKVVDNFLLDPPSTSQNEEPSTLLRHLLAGRRKVPPDGGIEQGSHSHSESNPTSEHFFSESQSSERDDALELGQEVRIKQEPADEADFIHTFSSSDNVDEGLAGVHAAGASGVEIAFPAVTSHGHLSDHGQTIPQSQYPLHFLSADSNMSLRDILNRSQQRTDVSQVAIQSVKQDARPESKDVRQQSMQDPSDKSSLSPAEKLKALSHMTLRDILTMKVPLGLEVNPAPSASTVNVTEISMVDEDGTGQVVWECGFCDFSALKKREVMSHRKHWHSDHVAHTEVGGYHGTYVDESSEDGSQFGNSYDETTQWSEPTYDGGHYPPSHQNPDRTQDMPHSSHHKAATPKNRGRPKSQKMMDDYEYDYQSASPLSIESSSESEIEKDDPEDQNYVPPYYLLDKTASSGSESEIGRQKKTRSGVGRKYQHRGRRGRGKLNGNPDRQPAKRMWSCGGQRTSIVTIGVQGNGFYNPCYRYQCLYCHHPPASLLMLKQHVRSACDSDTRHLLMAEMISYPHSVLFICPKESCCFVSASEKAFLEHVLPCQGIILEASEKSVQDIFLERFEQFLTSGRESGTFQCSVSGCLFVAHSVDSLKKHVKEHVDRFHASQMLLFHTVCTAMTKVYYDANFVCYLCTEWILSVDEACTHSREKHGGDLRGVFHVVETDNKPKKLSKGLLVSIICMRCRQQVPHLDQWYYHTCAGTPTSQNSCQLSVPPQAQTGSTGSCVPSLGEWPWKIAKSTSIVSMAGEEAVDSTRQNILPLVRSILLDKAGIVTDKRNLTTVPKESQSKQQAPLPKGQATDLTAGALPTSRPLSNRQTVDSDRKSDGGTQAAASTHSGNSNDDDVVSCTVCDVCQESVPETQWKKHECFVNVVQNSSSAPNSVPPSENNGNMSEAGSSKKRKLHHGGSTTEKQTPPMMDGEQPVKRSHRLLTKRLRSLGKEVTSDPISSGKSPECSQGESQGLIRNSETPTLNSGSGDITTAAVNTGSPSLRSLLVRLPPGDGDAWDKVMKQAQGSTSLLRDRLICQREAATSVSNSASTQQQKRNLPSAEQQRETLCGKEDDSVENSGPGRYSTRQRTPPRSKSQLLNMSSLHRAATSGIVSPKVDTVASTNLNTSAVEYPSASASLAELAFKAKVDNPESPSGDTQSGMGESADMVSWLHQQGNQMMRVLGDAMPQDDHDA